METEWETPQYFFDILDKEFNFELDVCANKENAKCKYYINKERNALIREWNAICWMNPPYQNTYNWVKKAYKEAKKEST